MGGDDEESFILFCFFGTLRSPLALSKKGGFGISLMKLCFEKNCSSSFLLKAVLHKVISLPLNFLPKTCTPFKITMEGLKELPP